MPGFLLRVDAVCRRSRIFGAQRTTPPEGGVVGTNQQKPGGFYLILASLNATCLRATGSYFLKVNFSVLVREFFLVT